MTRGWHGDPGRHALARKGMKTSIPRRYRSTPHKSLMLRPKDTEALRAVQQEAHILESQIDERRVMLARLDMTVADAEMSGDREAARRARMLQEEMLRDIEMRVEKLHEDVSVLEREHASDSSVRQLVRETTEISLGYNALEMRYG